MTLSGSLQEDFLQWLKTGIFHGVELGMRRSQCIERHGTPLGWEAGKRANFYEWPEHIFEFHFTREDEKYSELNTDQVFLICTEESSRIANLFGVSASKILSLSYVLSFLSNHEIVYSLLRNENNNRDFNQTTVILSHRIFFHFFGDFSVAILKSIEQIR